MGSAVPIVIVDLDESDGGLTPSAGGQWEWGVPTSGPGGTDRVWATRLAGNYLNDSDDTLTFDLPDVAGALAPVLVVDAAWDVRVGDFGTVELDNGSGFRRLDPVYGYPAAAGFVGVSDGYQPESFDLSGATASARVRLRFQADSSATAAGWYVRSLAIYDGDATAPRIDALAVPVDTQDVDGPYPIELAVDDDVGVTSVAVMASFGAASAVEFPAVDLGDRWHVDLPSQPPGTVVRWWAVASDGSNEAVYPATGDLGFRVFLAAPTRLSGPEGRIVATSVHLAWSPPATPEPVRGYRVVEVGDESHPIDVIDPEADVPLAPDGSHTWTVCGRFDAGFGDSSAPLHLDPSVPELGEVSPAIGWPGDRIRVSIGGQSLFLLDGVSELDLGDGIAVESLAVVDVNDARAVIRVADDAAVGPRDLAVSGPYGEYAFPAVFDVADAADRPAIVDVGPASVAQGFAGSVRFTASDPFAGEVTPLVDDDLVITGVTTDANAVTIDLVVSGVAGVGSHPIELDDGERLWAADLVVTERIVTTGSGCSTSPGRFPGFAAVLAALAFCRCRRSLGVQR
jgi:hypothetical protein